MSSEDQDQELGVLYCWSGTSIAFVNLGHAAQFIIRGTSLLLAALKGSDGSGMDGLSVPIHHTPYTQDESLILRVTTPELHLPPSLACTGEPCWCPC